MSYPKDLDEYTTDELRAELSRRANVLAEGNCDYCGRAGDSSPCRFPERHQQAAIALRNKRLMPFGLMIVRGNQV